VGSRAERSTSCASGDVAATSSSTLNAAGSRAYEALLSLLAGPPADLVRKDKRFAELGLDAKDYITREQVVTLLLAHPELMERPVVIRGKRAVIARPSERVLELFE
jgi:arsenate reductase